MRIYTIKGETQLSKSPQILVAYPRASDPVRPYKLFSSKFPCTDDAVVWQGPRALYLAHLRSSALVGVNTCPVEWSSGV